MRLHALSTRDRVSVCQGTHQQAVLGQRFGDSTRFEQRVLPAELHDFAQVIDELLAPLVVADLEQTLVKLLVHCKKLVTLWCFVLCQAF